MISLLYKNKRYLTGFLYSIFFNFKNLPFEQAKKLPIIFYSVSFVRNPFKKMKVIINSNAVDFGMIRIGYPYVNNWCIEKKCVIDIEGTVIFYGKCLIFQKAHLSVYKNAMLEFGKNFSASSGLNLCCVNKITFQEEVMLGWDVTIMDTDFHYLVNNENTNTNTKSINIGKNNWIGAKCIITKGTHTPNYCTFGAGSVISGIYGCKEKTILKGNPAVEISSGWFLKENEIIRNHFKINNEKLK